MARIKHGTLVANQVTHVDLPANSGTVEIMILANAAAIFFRCDGVDPAVDGDDCEVIPAGVGAALAVDLPDPFDIRLISEGTPKYTVKGF